jgi:hypothetical protein
VYQTDEEDSTPSGVNVPAGEEEGARLGVTSCHEEAITILEE